MEALNLTKFMAGNGSLSISTEKAANGIILNGTIGTVDTTVDPPLQNYSSNRFVFGGSPEEIYKAIDASLGLGKFFSFDAPKDVAKK